MSRMTKFLKQTCLYEPAIRDADGKPILNMYGEPTYGVAVELKGRREKSTKDVLTVNGSILRSDTIYYLDELQEVRTDDKLDGHIVLSVSEYVNEFGKVEGYEAHA